MSATQRDGDPGMRRARLAKIHMAKKKLAMEEESYRAMLRRITGHDTAAALDLIQLNAVLEEFKRLGFHGGAPRRWRPAAQKPHVRKVFALWHALKPYLRDDSDAALRAFVRRHTRDELHPDGVGDPAWLAPEEANKVTEGLKAWLAREKRRAASEAHA